MILYRVTVRINGEEYLLHDLRDEKIQLINPEFSEEIGKNGTFTFSISPVHPNKDKIIPVASEIILWKDKEMFFCCRMLDSQSDFYNTGRATCEGDLAYLLDSLQRPYEFTGSVYEYITKMLTIHNGQVEERKRFSIGNITVAGAQIMRSNPDYSNTMREVISQQEISGGYFHVRYADGKKYLDYIHDYGGINSQVIRFGENLIDLTRHVSAMNLITMLVPIGATLENPDGTEESKAVDITSVNGGRDYIYHQEAVNRYGQIWGSQKFEDITDPETLLAKAHAYLDEIVAIPETIEIKAVDLSVIDVDMEPMKVGYWTNVISKPHGLNTRFMLSKKLTNLCDPGRNSIVLGKTPKTFTGESVKEQRQVTARINNVASGASKEINRKVENATQLITGGKGGYVVLDVEDDDGKRTLPWRILIMNTPDKDTAANVIQLNQNGIGFSTTGINGPYVNAWTIDGNLIADFVTAGTMLADRIRGGTLELGGSGLGRDGSIVVMDANGTQIGRWDKDGLNMLKGILQGVSAVFGGSGLGRDGSLIIKNKKDDEIGRIDIDGIEIKRRGAVGFKADGDVVRIGDFEVADAHGRQILQSVDEKTGMCGEPEGDGQWYLWAGWNHNDDYAFAVNNRQEVHAKTMWLHTWNEEYEKYKAKNELHATLYPEKFEACNLPYIILDLYNNHNLNDSNIMKLGTWYDDLEKRVRALE